ncbi:MAG: ABC transporter ATP-binding protein [Eubacteriales bacterium]|nr:ABC transporter ATP-binding protein [Eubacteriales bacterium]MDY4898689.1 ABC transporter ATP-binding protein [Eubacteriales bacterium]
MIKTSRLDMYFGDFCAIKQLTVSIPEGCVYGLVGSNGAGKSTLLRILSGIYRQTNGDVTIDNCGVYENPSIKEQIVFVPDELFFLPQANLREMGRMWQRLYRSFDMSRLCVLAEHFELDMNANINTFSKGMKRQAAIILALSAKPKYLFLDETFDGLDPIKRNMVRNLIYDDIIQRHATAILSSHSLRELEDTCDQLALLHRGGLVLESDIQNLKTSLFKVQVGYTQPFGRDMFYGVNMTSYRQSGSVATLIVRGDRDALRHELMNRSPAPAILDILPLSLEEVFIYELDALGYSDGLDELKEVRHE